MRPRRPSSPAATLGLLLLFLSPATPLLPPLGRQRRRSAALLRASNADDAAELVKAGQSDLRRDDALSRVLTGLTEPDKYNTVLAGLAATLLADARLGSSEADANVGELLALLQEMAERKISPSLAAAGAVLDGAAATGSPGALLRALQGLKACGTRCVAAYGTAAARLKPLPRDGNRRRRALEGVPPLPDDQRLQELWLAVSSLAYAGTAGGFEVAVPFTDDPSILHSGLIPEVMLAASAAGAGLDLWRNGGATLLQLRAGLSRLFYKDPIRDARCEAASLVVGYLLGLPSFAFRPSLQEAVSLLETDDPVLRDALPPGTASVSRILVWLLAPVAGEDTQYSQLLASDPREGAAFLALARARGVPDVDFSPEEAQELVLWAYGEARKLVRGNEALVDRICDRMERGQGSVGDCVAMVDGQL